MKSVTKKITTNTRVIRDLLTRYQDTFCAFRELINNSIQATAKTIKINIEYADDISIKSGIRKIEIIDDGYGVSYSDFDKRILEIGTTIKPKGHGIGRFSALQIGNLMHIETVAYDGSLNEFTKTRFSVDTLDLKDAQFEETEFKIEFENLGKTHRNTYYKVIIEDLFHNKMDEINKRNKLTEDFLGNNINQSIFEKYPFDIFNEKVKFRINGKDMKKDEFIIGKPKVKKTTYVDKNGVDCKMNFHFYNVKSKLNKAKVFYLIENAGLKSVAHEYTYSSYWYTPDLGTWFIYVDSPILDTDLFRNINFENLGEEEINNLKTHTKEEINSFFKSRNKKFDKFIQNLEQDKYYPYSKNCPATQTQEVLFKKVAYLVEDEYRLINDDNKIRDFFYQLLDKAISNGHIEEIFNKVLKLSDEGIEKFHSLLNKTDLKDVVQFASQVAEKLEFLDFLQEITYGKISSVIKERSQLHKIIEKQLWVFGENYNGTPHLWSDKKIGNILDEIRKNHFSYTPSEEDENLIKFEDDEQGLNDITDLFFYNEKIIDSGAREIMIVELKSPKCAISQKEINQIDRYAFTIESKSALPTENVKYKLILVSSHLTKFAKSKLDSARDKYGIPFLYDKKEDKNIEVYIIEWSELIELNKRRLGYLSKQLKIKDKSVHEKFEKEYSELVTEKINSRLTSSNI